MSPGGKSALLVALLAAVSAQALPGGERKDASFVDPTAQTIGAVSVGHQVYVAPFARLEGSQNQILIANEADVQDSVRVDAANGPIVIGSEAILAHGATVKGHAEIGIGGKCHGDPPPAACPSFVGFNAEVDGAIIEKDAMVGHLARVGPNVTIPSGKKVKAGMNVADEREVKDVTDGDRAFMHDVVEVNVAFAEGYAALAAENPVNVRGINYNPNTPPFNP